MDSYRVLKHINDLGGFSTAAWIWQQQYTYMEVFNKWQQQYVDDIWHVQQWPQQYPIGTAIFMVSTPMTIHIYIYADGNNKVIMVEPVRKTGHPRIYFPRKKMFPHTYKYALYVYLTKYPRTTSNWDFSMADMMMTVTSEHLKTRINIHANTRQPNKAITHGNTGMNKRFQKNYKISSA